MGEIALFITSKAKPGKRDEILELYQEFLAPRAEENDGQEAVMWAADQQDPDTFHLFEVYTDGESLGANAQSAWFADYMAKAGPLLAGEPVVAMASPMWAKGL
ncbi:MAG: antibiotic biosynthesis monooxygenase [Actinomycetota bacterium]